jgi:F-type H+-transporting ATPase subunit a
MAGPTIDALSQFRLTTGLGPIGRVVNFTNSNEMMLVAVAIIVVLFSFGMRSRAVVPGRMQSLVESLYEFVYGMCLDNIGEEGRKFFPLVFTIFIFILLGNLLGLFPYFFAYTSGIVVTLTMALSVRLFANMTAGHVMLEVFAGFMILLTASLGVFGAVASIIPLGLNVALIALELLVACLQAYVFAVLTCLYLHDAVHMH